MAKKDSIVDLNKALVFQVGHLGEAYDKWVHQPIITKEGPRFFDNDVLELLTKTVWWAVPLIWVPVAFWFISKSVSFGVAYSNIAALVVCGIAAATLTEYIMHRFLFHIKTTSYWGNTTHYLLHGYHHKHPMDALRLVLPPAVTLIMIIPLWILLKLLTPETVTPAVFAGLLLGYVKYDCTHYFLHHSKPGKLGLQSELKTYHMNHHFRIQDMGFGVTSSFWDKVFGTYPPSYDQKKKKT
ncbi:dihydroceramide fatty acyl 2-hydroxylase FAH1-like [Impatiens glandulifera]|uniref:dihydroceramide fatty acyl 2-hydroxylase FAH1-like n=1 Tax=Impatiens glandulifera TaxID=253017 RepID=UPI001FB0F5DC|nr:dihydroceramide fatty acyl 2-hydroxylase FAH1-like [Impatiens glandulifera]